MPRDEFVIHTHMPFETVNAGGTAPVLLLCDHATNIVPPEVNDGSLGLGSDEMSRHIAFDIGARAVTLELAKLMNAPALLSRFSRLVIDPNRGEDDPTLVMRLYDGTIVPANRNITAEEKQQRLVAYHRPYHAAITERIDTMVANGQGPALISIHSYTPKLKGRAMRPWHIGVLWHHDERLSRPLIDRLSLEPDLCIGDNEPYGGELEGDCLSRHGTRRGLAHVLIELRHDLIETEADQRKWAERLAPHLSEVVAQAQQMELTDG